MTAFYNSGPYGISHYSAGAFVDFSGVVPIVFSLGPAALTGSFVLGGALDLNISFPPAVAQVGPLWAGGWGPDIAPPTAWGPVTPCSGPVWGQNTPCPDPGWTPQELCD